MERGGSSPDLVARGSQEESLSLRNRVESSVSQLAFFPMDKLQRDMQRYLKDLKEGIKGLLVTKPWKKTHFLCAVVIVLQIILWIVMFLSEQPQADLKRDIECDRAQLLAEVASLKKQLGAMEKEVEKEKRERDRQLAAQNQILRKTKLALEKATKGSDVLQADLAAANQNLSETEQRWKSCQAQLDSTKGKATSLEKERNNLQQENQRLRGTIDDLRKQLSSRERDLENVQQWFQNQAAKKQQNHQLQNVGVDMTEIAAGFFLLLLLLLLFLLLACISACVSEVKLLWQRWIFEA